jgi:hypothetical protein
MPKTSTLIALVHSLSKAEKRYFSLFTRLQSGSKDYLTLYKILTTVPENQQALKKTFKKRHPSSSYETALKHLYKVLTDSLLHLRLQQDTRTRLITSVLKANILFEKSLFEEGFCELKRIIGVAEQHEEHTILLLAARIELYYLCHLNFHAIAENELIKKQMKMQEILRYAANTLQHNSLYELLLHRLTHKGHVRTNEQKTDLNDLVVSEMNIIVNPLAATFESKKLHLLFQANYFIATNDYASAITLFYELNTLFNNHRYLWTDSPVYYLSVIEGILESLRSIRQYHEMNYFLNTLETLTTQTVYFNIMCQRVVYIYKLTTLLDCGEFKAAKTFSNNFDAVFLKKLEVLDTDKQAEVYLYTALIYFGNNDLDKAHFYLRKILLQSKLYYNLPFYQTFRLINLLVQYELGNHDLIYHEIRSVKRKMKSTQSKTYKVEKLIFSFLQLPLKTLSGSERKAIWHKFNASFENITHDKYEIKILQIFDFAGWIESKLCQLSFESILKKKMTAQIS